MHSLINYKKYYDIQEKKREFKCWLFFKKMVLVKSFIAGALHDRFKLIHLYLNKGDKIRECYSSFKVMIQAHLHIGLFKIFFIKDFLPNPILTIVFGTL